MRTATKVAIVVAGLTTGSMLGAPAAYASGDAPWCAVSEIGEGALSWDCQYETAEQCAPTVSGGNRGSCTPNPYAPNPAPASARTMSPGSATPGAAHYRKGQERAK